MIHQLYTYFAEAPQYMKSVFIWDAEREQKRNSDKFVKRKNVTCLRRGGYVLESGVATTNGPINFFVPRVKDPAPKSRCTKILQRKNRMRPGHFNNKNE